MGKKKLSIDTSLYLPRQKPNIFQNMILPLSDTYALYVMIPCSSSLGVRYCIYLTGIRMIRLHDLNKITNIDQVDIYFQ